MAILIGVIALAVIPNIQRSRESKDISQLDSFASAANSAIATTQTTGAKTIVLCSTQTGLTAVASGDSGLVKTIKETLSAGAGKMNSGQATASGLNVVLSYDTAAKKIQVAITTDPAADSFTDLSSSNKVAKCKYLKDGDNDQKYFVEN